MHASYCAVIKFQLAQFMWELSHWSSQGLGMAPFLIDRLSIVEQHEEESHVHRSVTWTGLTSVLTLAMVKLPALTICPDGGNHFTGSTPRGPEVYQDPSFPLLPHQNLHLLPLPDYQPYCHQSMGLIDALSTLVYTARRSRLVNRVLFPAYRGPSPIITPIFSRQISASLARRWTKQLRQN